MNWSRIKHEIDKFWIFYGAEVLMILGMMTVMFIAIRFIG